MRNSVRLLLVSALAVGALFGAVPASHATEGCILGPPGTPQPDPNTNVGGSECTYTAAQEGSWIGVGDFDITVVRGTETLTFDETHADSNGVPGAADTGTIQPGDVVTASVTSGALAIGNPE